MTSRRAALGGLAAAAACGCAQHALAQWPGVARPARVTPVAVGGCGLNDERVIAFAREVRFRTSLEEAPALENFFDDCIASCEVVFEVRPAFGYYEDRARPNAFATPYAILGGTSPDGAVLFGETLLGRELRNASRNAGSSLLVILAHEYAHIRQFRERRGGTCPDTELEADFLAGWMLGDESMLRPGRGIPVHLRSAAETMFAYGGYEFNSPDFHGTPEQRMNAVMRGFALGRTRVDIGTAYRASLRGG